MFYFLAGDSCRLNVQFGDTFETLFDVFIYSDWILAISKQLKKIVIGQEVKSWEVSSLSFEQTEQDLLAFIQPFRNVLKVLQEILHKQTGNQLPHGISLDSLHMGR